jgi:hypothetical protein
MVIVAITALVAPYFKGWWKILPWALAASVCLARMYLGAHSPCTSVPTSPWMSPRGGPGPVHRGRAQPRVRGAPRQFQRRRHQRMRMTWSAHIYVGGLAGRILTSWLAACPGCGHGEIMTTPPETHTEPPAAAAPHRVWLLPPSRYRHPGDVIRLIIAGLVLVGVLAIAVAADAAYAGASATAVTAVAHSTLAGRVLVGLVQAVFVASAAVAVVVTLRYRRYRLLLELVVSAVLAGAVIVGVMELAGGQRPHALTAGAGPWPWLTPAGLGSGAVLDDKGNIVTNAHVTGGALRWRRGVHNPDHQRAGASHDHVPGAPRTRRTVAGEAGCPSTERARTDGQRLSDRRRAR